MTPTLPPGTPDAAWRALFTNARDGLLLLDDEHRILAANPAAVRLLGRPAAALRALALQELIDPASAAQLVRRRSSTPGGDAPPEVGIRLPDGSLRWVDAWISPGVPPARYLCALRDATPRRAAAAALRRAEERFLTVLQASPNPGSISRVADGRVLEVNAAWLRILGYPREEVIGRSMDELGVWTDREARARMVAGVQAQGTVRGIEMTFRRNGGAVGQGLLSAVAITFAGEPCVLVITHDLSDRVESQAALRRSEERFAKVFRSSPDAILIIRAADSQVLEANDSWCAMTGYSRSEIARLGPVALRIWCDPEQREQVFRRAREEGAVRDVEYAFRRKSGEIGLASIAIEVTSIENTLCFLAISRDITERRHMEEQARATERLSVLGRVAAGVAHEFNNVLAAIMGRLDLLALGEHNPADAATLRLIQQAVDDGAAMVKRIQTFARLRDPRRFTAVAVSDLVRDVTALTQPRWQGLAARGGSPGIILRTQVEEGLAIAGDPTELREVLTNLILNAVDALPRGGEIRVGATAAGPHVRITVQDTGLGMDEMTRARIFDPFFTTKPSGTGLGLTVIRDIVESHGGSVEVQATPGEGTLFVLLLPAATGLPAAAPVPALVPAPHPARILAVDDDPGLGDMLRTMLAVAGHEVAVTTSGAEALELLDQQPFDLVCTDLGMPGMNGWEVARQVRARAPGLPIILITGWGVHLDPDELAAQTVDYVLPKPFRVAQVQEVVGRALARKAAGP